MRAGVSEAEVAGCASDAGWTVDFVWMWVAIPLLLLPSSASMNAVASSFQPAVGAGAGADGVGDFDELAASAVATGSVSEGRRGELSVAEELALAAEAMKNEDTAKDYLCVGGGAGQAEAGRSRAAAVLCFSQKSQMFHMFNM